MKLYPNLIKLYDYVPKDICHANNIEIDYIKKTLDFEHATDDDLYNYKSLVMLIWARRCERAKDNAWMGVNDTIYASMVSITSIIDLELSKRGGETFKNENAIYVDKGEINSNNFVTSVGDIVLHDGEKYLTVKREQLKEIYEDEKYSIEGVVVVPNDKTHDGTTRMISLVNMDCDNPEHGCANEDKYIVWGGYDFKIPEIKSVSINDFDGKGNTEKILKYYTAEDWKTVGKISNKYDKGYYPAAACCKRYKTKHTDDWYLPAIGELTYLYDNSEVISKTFDTIIDVIGADNARQISASWFWSSSEYSVAYACAVTLGGYMLSTSKYSSTTVRAFAAVAMQLFGV